MQPARKITWALFAAQALSSTGFLASATITPIVGADLSGRPEWAGVPSAVYQLGVAAASLLLGYGMDRLGRRRALVLGLTIGAVGAAIAGWAIVAGTFVGFLCGLALMGPANAASALSRFVAADVHPAEQRGRAIANVVIGGTAGTLLWPLLSVTLGPRFVRMNLSDLLWPFLVSVVLLAVTAVVIFTFLRPEPEQIARALARSTPEAPSAGRGVSPSIAHILRRPGALVAIWSMVCAHTVMIMVMVITALHMRNHHHGVTAISLTTSLHVLGMFGFSIVSGRLADRIGRVPLIICGAGVLILACLIAPLSPAFVPITAGLFLLGLGWNFCFVGGSALLADHLSDEERGRTQGFNDLLMGLVAAMGSFLSGHVFASVGYQVMGAIAAAFSLTSIALAAWWQHARRGDRVAAT